MRLIYLVQYFPPENASGLHLVEDLLEGFAKHGWNVDLFTPTPTRGITFEQRKEYCKRRIEKKYDGKLTIHRMHLYKEGAGIISRALRYFIFSIECFWKAVTVPADFIFTGSGPPTQGLVVGLAKKLSPKKVIYNLQDIFPDSLVTSGICSTDSKLMIIGHKMENFTYRNADLIITITEDMKSNVVAKGIDPEKVKVVRNWIDVNKVCPIKPENNKLFDELGLERGQFYVVYAGNLGKVQGVEVILKAAKLLINRNNIRFVIFGNGSEEVSIRLYAQQLPNVSIFPLQPMDRISEVYSLGNVSVVSCKPGTGGSGMPSKTWSIMAAGTAIIASFDLEGEMERTIQAAHCGLCVRAGDEKALADAICEMSNDPESVKKMAFNAREYAEKHVAKDQAVKQYIQYIENVVTE